MTSDNEAEHEAGESAAAVSAKAVDDQLIDELVSRAQAEGLQLTGEGGLLQQLTKRLLESALEGEITDHLGYDKHDPAGKDGGNSRNGNRSKTVLTAVGPVEIAVPRDRDGSFEPRIVRKRQKRLTGVDEMVISLAAKGLTTGEVQAHLAEVYGAEVSRQTISTITDKVLEGMAEWQSRPLDAVYPVVFIDAIHVKIRDGAVANRPVYVALAVTTDGRREILGLWAGDGGEGAKHWLHILTEIKNRGVGDVLMLVCDGLKGLPEAVETVWPRTIVQTCVVHLLRNSFRYAARQDWDKIAKLLKPVYTAPTEESALDRFAEFAEAWGRKYPAIVKLWENAWEEFTPFLRFDTEIRRIVCTTNAIESVNARIRRAVKARGHFPNEQAALKCVYMAIMSLDPTGKGQDDEVAGRVTGDLLRRPEVVAQVRDEDKVRVVEELTREDQVAAAVAPDFLRRPAVVARVAKADKVKVVEELTRDEHVAAEVTTGLLRRPDVAFKAMSDDTARHQVNRAQVDQGRQAREHFEETSPVAPAIRNIDRSVEFLDLVTACHAFVAAAGRVVPGMRDRQLGDDERVIVHENVARVRATLDWIETAVDTGKVDVDGELAKLLQGE